MPYYLSSPTSSDFSCDNEPGGVPLPQDTNDAYDSEAVLAASRTAPASPTPIRSSRFTSHAAFVNELSEIFPIHNKETRSAGNMSSASQNDNSDTGAVARPASVPLTQAYLQNANVGPPRPSSPLDPRPAVTMVYNIPEDTNMTPGAFSFWVKEVVLAAAAQACSEDSTQTVLSIAAALYVRAIQGTGEWAKNAAKMFVQLDTMLGYENIFMKLVWERVEIRFEQEGANTPRGLRILLGNMYAAGKVEFDKIDYILEVLRIFIGDIPRRKRNQAITELLRECQATMISDPVANIRLQFHKAKLIESMQALVAEANQERATAAAAAAGQA